MRGRARQLKERLRTGYWPIPGSMVLGAIPIAEFFLWLDRTGRSQDMPVLSWLQSVGPEGSRAVLSAIAASMITVAATVFSVTTLTLSFASQQFGPRLLRHFMRDHYNQFTLGALTSTFVYSLLILRTATDWQDQTFIPHLSVSFGMLLALTSVGVLIVFIHHVSVQIQAPQVIAVVTKELQQQIDDFFPEQIGSEPAREPEPPPEEMWENCARISASSDGYIEAIDDRAPLEIASKEDLMVRLLVRPGRFIVKGQICALVWPPERLTPEIGERISGSILLSSRRTPAQDPAFAVHQLVEIAARALSPSLNDPFTAAECTEHLGAVMVRLARRSIPSRYRTDKEGRLRVIVDGPNFVEVFRLGFEPIRQYGSGHPIVVSRMLDALALIGDTAQRPEDRAAVLDELDRILISTDKHLGGDPQQPAIRSRIDAVRRVIHGPTRSELEIDPSRAPESA